MNQMNSAASKQSFAPYASAPCHEHDHRYTPHLHTSECERYLSGFDKNRNSRFYYTKSITPCRVYLSYNEKLLTSGTEIQIDNKIEKLSQVNQGLNGRKLSPRTLKSHLKISPQFIEDAKNFIFVKETMSLIPPLPQAINFSPPLTYAEMAVMPFNLPPINQVLPTNTKTKVTNQSSQVKSVKINVPKSTSPTSTSWSSSDK
ncbi:unnamed protein product [Brachionus calyciflorus]|uniref:Uncharacterized protein n=1 Tax=Brachionus calyciflorus TaxID=104777 RepID=A0A813M6Q2_9BILA|nr:unnamed protein product [Brachionus calyciflorus]